MTQLSFDQVMQLLKESQLHYYNFYNNDIKYNIQQTCRWYLTNTNDNITKNQPIHALYLDIEVYNNNQGMSDHDVDHGTNPINIVTIYDDQEQIFHTYLLLFDSNIKSFGITGPLNDDQWIEFITQRQNYYISELKNRNYVGNEYIPEIKGLELHVFFDERLLLQELWKHIHEQDPDILTSWNGDKFDYWYMYNRCVTLFGEEQVGNILSKFGKVSINNKMVQFCEYSVADLLYFYRPRDEGG